MDFALFYLPQRALYRLGGFFHHWYLDGSRVIGHRFIMILENLDQTFAVKVTLEHFFEPLYKDYSAIGRIMGVVFRSLRVLIGLTIYLMVAAVSLAFYLVWLVLPILLISYAFLSIR